MHLPTRHHAVAALLAAAALPAAAVTIQFDYRFDTSGFFTQQLRRDVLQAAGDYWSAVLTDTLTAIAPGGQNRWTALSFDPVNPDTGGNVSLTDLQVAADAILIFVGGATDLDPGVLGVGGPGGYSASGFRPFLDNLETRGESGVVINGPGDTDFAPWGGSIGFSSTASWYFDADVSTDEAFGGFDFYSVALHEVAHVLGFGLSESWDALVNGALFTGAMASAVNGGPVPLNAGRDHFANGTLSDVLGVPREAAMDPDIAAGVRKRITTLDLAAMDDIGWDIAYPAPPSPEPVNLPVPLWVPGLLAVICARRALAGVACHPGTIPDRAVDSAPSPHS